MTAMLAVAALLLGAGCLSRPAIAPRSFALEAEATQRAPAARPSLGVVVLRPIEIASLFDSRLLVYRTGEGSYERDPYAEWLVPPNRMLALPVRNALRVTGLFADVLEPGSALPADLWMELTAQELCGDFSQPSAPSARLALRVVLAQVENKKPARIVFQQDFSAAVRVENRTAAAVVGGLNRALTKILDQLTTALAEER